MIPNEPDTDIRRRYLLVITRKHSHYRQLLFASDLHEARDAIDKLSCQDFTIKEIRLFRPAAFHG